MVKVLELGKSPIKGNGRDQAKKLIDNMGEEDSLWMVVMKPVTVDGEEGHKATELALQMSPETRATAFLQSARLLKFDEDQMETIFEIAAAKVEELQSQPSSLRELIGEMLKGTDLEKVLEKAAATCNCPKCRAEREAKKQA